MREKQRKEMLCQIRGTTSRAGGGGRGGWAVSRRGSRIGALKGGGSRMNWRDQQVFSCDSQLETTDGDCSEEVVVLG